jgi:hypothetical protein
MWWSCVAFIPYLLLAGVYTFVTNGHQRDFEVALGVLLGGRALFGVVDTVTSAIAWRLYARKRTTESMLKLFKDAGMPTREPADESLSMYLLRLDEDREHPVQVKCAARQLSTLLEQTKHDGIAIGMRTEEAIKAAFEQYTAKEPVGAHAAPN